MSQPIAAPKNAMQKFLAVVERVGNKVPHPAVIFLILIAIVVVLSGITGNIDRYNRRRLLSSTFRGA